MYTVMFSVLSVPASPNVIKFGCCCYSSVLSMSMFRLCRFLKRLPRRGESWGFDPVAFHAVPDLGNYVHNVEAVVGKVWCYQQSIVKSFVDSNHEDEGMVNLNCQWTIKVVDGDVPKNRINKGPCFPQGNTERREGNSLACLWWSNWRGL